MRSRPATNAIKFTVDVEALLKESCEGFELRVFNKTESQQSRDLAEKENIALNSVAAAIEEKPQEKRAPVACPMRKKTKNENGEVVNEDEDCLACGS